MSRKPYSMSMGRGERKNEDVIAERIENHGNCIPLDMEHLSFIFDTIHTYQYEFYLAIENKASSIPRDSVTYTKITPDNHYTYDKSIIFTVLSMVNGMDMTCQLHEPELYTKLTKLSEMDVYNVVFEKIKNDSK